MAQLFEAAPANDLPAVPNYNVCPTNPVHVVTSGTGRRLVAMRWGFIPKWYRAPNDGPLLINARAETIAEKPAFRDACRARRCLIPASGFYEWTTGSDGAKEPWYIAHGDGTPLAFAGIWQVWERGEATLSTCAIVTTLANRSMSAIHQRMPVTIEPDDWGLWLGEKGGGAARLMKARPEDRFVFHRVDAAVNSNRASGPDLIRLIDQGGVSGP